MRRRRDEVVLTAGVRGAGRAETDATPDRSYVARLLHGRQQERDEPRDDPEDDEEFEEGEASVRDNLNHMPNGSLAHSRLIHRTSVRGGDALCIELRHTTSRQRETRQSSRCTAGRWDPVRGVQRTWGFAYKLRQMCKMHLRIPTQLSARDRIPGHM